MRPLGAEVLDREAGRVDDRLVLVGVQRADRVDDRAAGLHALRRGPQQRELELRQRLAHASAGRAARRARRGRSTARRRARGRSRSARPAARAPSALTTRTFVAPSRRTFSSSSRARPSCSSTATTSPASIVALPPGAAQRSSMRSPAGSRRRARRAASRGSAARSAPPRAPARRRARRAQAPGTSVGSPGDLAAHEPDDGLRRLVLRPHQRERLVLAPVARASVS